MTKNEFPKLTKSFKQNWIKCWTPIMNMWNEEYMINWIKFLTSQNKMLKSYVVAPDCYLIKSKGYVGYAAICKTLNPSKRGNVEGTSTTATAKILTSYSETKWENQS